MDGWIIYSGLGALGGVITTLQWLEDRRNKSIENRKDINIYKIIRNLALGAIAGGFFGTTTNNMFVALLTGTSGEFYIQKAGKAIQARIPILNK